MLKQLSNKVTQMKKTKEGKRQLTIYAVIGVLLLGVVVYNVVQMNRKYEDGTLITKERRETRGQRKARVQAEQKKRVEELESKKGNAAAAQKAAKERAEKARSGK